MNIKNFFIQSAANLASFSGVGPHWKSPPLSLQRPPQIVIAGDPVVMYKTTHHQQYLVQRLSTLEALHITDGTFSTTRNDKLQKQSLRVQKLDTDRYGRPTYDIVMTTRVFDVNELDYANCHIAHFRLCLKRISDARVIFYRRLSSGPSTQRIVDYRSTLEDVSDDRIGEIECLLLP